MRKTHKHNRQTPEALDSENVHVGATTNPRLKYPFRIEGVFPQWNGAPTGDTGEATISKRTILPRGSAQHPRHSHAQHQHRRLAKKTWGGGEANIVITCRVQGGDRAFILAVTSL